MVRFLRPWRGYREGEEVEGLGPGTEARLIAEGVAGTVDPTAEASPKSAPKKGAKR